MAELMDRLEAMSMLIEVVDCGSFSAAARRLHVPLTTVARKISSLESALGAKLMIRTTRKLSLTDAGLTYIETARRIIDQVNEAERAVAGEFTVPRGDLVITAPIQFGQLYVLPIVTDFLALFPEINIRLLLLDQNIQLVNYHVDMAVRIGKLADSALISTSIGAMRTVICASPRLLAVHGMPTTIADLQSMPCVTFDGPGPLSGWNLTDPRTKTPVAVPVTTRLSVTTVEAAVRGAMLHAGVTRLLHYQVAGAVKAGALKIVLEQFEPVPAPVSVVHAAQGQMPLKMRRFMDFSIPKLRRALREFLDEKGEHCGEPNPALDFFI